MLILILAKFTIINHYNETLVFTTLLKTPNTKYKTQALQMYNARRRQLGLCMESWKFLELTSSGIVLKVYNE